MAYSRNDNNANNPIRMHALHPFKLASTILMIKASLARTLSAVGVSQFSTVTAQPTFLKNG